MLIEEGLQASTARLETFSGILAFSLASLLAYSYSELGVHANETKRFKVMIDRAYATQEHAVS